MHACKQDEIRKFRQSQDEFSVESEIHEYTMDDDGRNDEEEPSVEFNGWQAERTHLCK